MGIAAENASKVSAESSRQDRINAAGRAPQAAICGANALYMFLAAHGQGVSANEFFHSVDVGEKGLSLAEVRDASNRFGVPATIRRCTYGQLDGGCPLPVIALLNRGEKGTSQSIGHYVVVVEVASDRVIVIDGTTGEMLADSAEEFCRDWTGYIILPERKVDWLSLSLVISLIVWVPICWFMLRPSPAENRKMRKRMAGDSTDENNR